MMHNMHCILNNLYSKLFTCIGCICRVLPIRYIKLFTTKSTSLINIIKKNFSKIQSH